MTASVQTTVLVHSLIQLGQALGLDVIAEGIEHPGQLQALQDAECPRAQGFLFSKAVSRRRIGQILERGYLPSSEHYEQELPGLVAAAADMAATDLVAPLDRCNEWI